MAKQKMETPYTALIGRRDNASKSYYMLSELIDNSISSWKNGGKKRKLIISISIDYKKKTIVATDNAFGMTKSKLENSIRLNIATEGNGLNMFGVGLKNAAFWFAQDLIIETKRASKAYSTSIETSKISDLSKTIEWEVVPTKRKSEGTTVKLINVYDEKRITESKLEEAITILSYKYKRYLEEGVSIVVDYIGRKQKAELESHELKPLLINAQIVPEKDIKNFVKSFKTHYKNINTKILKNLDKKVIFAAENSEPMSFKFDIPYDYEGKKTKFKILIGVQDVKNKKNAGGYSRLTGLATFQENRAINLPPKNAYDFGETIRTNLKRVYGEIELSPTFSPDNNKTEFVLGTHESHFKQIIKEIGREIETVADALHATTTTDEKANRNQSASSAWKTQNQLNSKTNIEWEVGQNESKTWIKAKNGKKIHFLIREVSTTDKDSNDYFINAKASRGKKDEFLISYNIDHPIWKPLSIDEGTTSIDLKTVTYPLVAIIGMLSLATKTKLIQEILDNYTENDLLSIVNTISKVVMK